jgi:hypothetical protein
MQLLGNDCELWWWWWQCCVLVGFAVLVRGGVLQQQQQQQRGQQQQHTHQYASNMWTSLFLNVGCELRCTPGVGSAMQAGARGLLLPHPAATAVMTMCLPSKHACASYTQTYIIIIDASSNMCSSTQLTATAALARASAACCDGDCCTDLDWPSAHVTLCGLLPWCAGHAHDVAA